MDPLSTHCKRTMVSLSVLLFTLLVATPAPVSAQPAIEVGSETMSEETVQQRIDEQMQRIKQRFGKRIKQKPQLKKKLEQRTKQQVVDQMVNQLVLLNHARKADISVNDSEIDERVDRIKKKSPKGKSFQDVLKQAGTNEQAFRKKIADSLLIKKFVDQRMDTVSVSSEEAREFYDQNSKRFKNKSFDQIKNRLVQMLEQRKRGQQMQKLIDDLKQQTDITVRI